MPQLDEAIAIPVEPHATSVRQAPAGPPTHSRRPLRSPAARPAHARSPAAPRSRSAAARPKLNQAGSACHVHNHQGTDKKSRGWAIRSCYPPVASSGSSPWSMPRTLRATRRVGKRCMSAGCRDCKRHVPKALWDPRALFWLPEGASGSCPKMNVRSTPRAIFWRSKGYGSWSCPLSGRWGLWSTQIYEQNGSSARERPEYAWNVRKKTGIAEPEGTNEAPLRQQEGLRLFLDF